MYRGSACQVDSIPQLCGHHNSSSDSDHHGHPAVPWWHRYIRHCESPPLSYLCICPLHIMSESSHCTLPAHPSMVSPSTGCVPDGKCWRQHSCYTSLHSAHDSGGTATYVIVSHLYSATQHKISAADESSEPLLMNLISGTQHTCLCAHLPNG